MGKENELGTDKNSFLRKSYSEYEAVEDECRRKLDERVLKILGVPPKAIKACWSTTVVQCCREPSVTG